MEFKVLKLARKALESFKDLPKDELEVAFYIAVELIKKFKTIETKYKLEIPIKKIITLVIINLTYLSF